MGLNSAATLPASERQKNENKFYPVSQKTGHIFTLAHNLLINKIYFFQIIVCFLTFMFRKVVYQHI